MTVAGHLVVVHSRMVRLLGRPTPIVLPKRMIRSWDDTPIPHTWQGREIDLHA